MRPRPLAPLALFVLTGHLACGPDPKADQVAPSAARFTAPNGMTQNSLSSNGLMQNGFFQNGLMRNGLMRNGLMQNGLLLGALWQDELWQQSPAAREVLRANAYTRDLLRYMYECAMGPEQSTALDPGPEGANLELHGLVGLAPQWGQAGGACDESCQRWVTACLLARTNAYGVKVDLSMRVPDDAPENVKAALAVTEEERAAYPLREGAFYGNLFRQEGQPDGTAVMAPKLYACAGPGSNVPEVTKRFCSSQGAGGPIEVPGTCEPRPEFPLAACLGVSGDAATGAMHDCYVNTDPSDRGEHYREVITVYLKRPIEVCGNSVCEADEAAEETCESDCHPGGWSRSFPSTLSSMKTLPVGSDGSTVVAGVAPTAVDLGGGTLDPGPEGNLHGVIAKYGPGGHYLSGKRFGPFAPWPGATTVALAPDGSIVAASSAGYSSGQAGSIWLGKFTPDGELMWSTVFGEDVDDDGTPSVTIREVAVERGGKIAIMGDFYGTVKFGDTTLNDKDTGALFLVRTSPQGGPQSATKFGQGSIVDSRAFAFDHEGNLYFSQFSDTIFGQGLHKFAAPPGAGWSVGGAHSGVAAGADGRVYAVGVLETFGAPFDLVYDFDVPPGAQEGDLFVVEYAAADGAPVRARVIPSNGGLSARPVAVDGDGNVVVGAFGGSPDVIDFGTGPFRTYGTPDAFVVAFTPGLEPLWSKHVPMVLGGDLGAMLLDGQGRVVTSGAFAGSMLVDDRLIVSHIPEQGGVSNTFLAAFAPPSASDEAPPVVDASHVPKPMTLEATSAAGVEVFFLPPTSTDAGLAGVSVDCSPPPNSVFPIGATTVTCTATDPLGHQASESFVVTVVDHLGPSFGNVPAAVTAGATSPAGAIVTYDPPSAVDLVDGERAVACSPASGSAFALGTTTVTCGAEDTKGVLTTVSFPVHVRYGGESCGNGTLDPGEACDDGNTEDGDGCASSCALENRAPDCSGAFASPAYLLPSTGQMWVPVAIAGVSDPDGDEVTVAARGVWQDEPVGLLWCPGGTCADATLEPLAVRAERDTWTPIGPQPDGRVYHIEFRATDAQGAQCLGLVTVCVQRRHDVMSCGDGGPLYTSLEP
ncbi:MAG TPA: HYR domain-containing protein [Polyangiaceae bacterium]|nr:HYR domain-containing protein [Polyangiaceae bacterium]